MFEAAFIKNSISVYMERGARLFAIWPMGRNGAVTKNVLDTAFSIEPESLIDNYIQNDNAIIKLEEFREGYDNNIYVILTAENEALNRKMKEELKKFVPENRVINLLRLYQREKDRLREDTYRRMQISNILPISADYGQKPAAKKIRIRILHVRYQTFNTIASICEAVDQDPDCELLVIIGWDQRQECIEQVKARGYSYVTYREYDIESDCPDVFVVSQPYDFETTFADIKKYAKLVVVANVLLIKNDLTNTWFIRTQKKSFERFCPDYYLCDSMLYEEIINFEEEFPFLAVEMGNAKYDGIYAACREKSFPNGWEKLKDKAVLLWATDHVIWGDYGALKTSVDLFAKPIFQYISQHPETGLIFRPHHELIRELLDGRFWTREDLKRFKEFCANSPNIIFDENETYGKAYAVADGIITDANCGVTMSALPTLKPVCMTYRSRFDMKMHPQLEEIHYVAYDSHELERFMEMIRTGGDLMYEKRKTAASKYVKHFDGKNGWRIKEFLKEKYYETK